MLNTGATFFSNMFDLQLVESDDKELMDSVG